MKSTPCILKIETLRIQEPSGTRLVDIEELSLERGRVLGMVGESGSGKSLTALSLMGLLPASLRGVSGRALFNTVQGKPVDLFRQDAREMRAIRGRKMTMIFQEPMTALNPVLTCGRQLLEMLELHTGGSKKQIRDRCLQLLQEVRMPEPERSLKKYPHQFSGGQRQRVMIAMALASGPELIIADEPTTALDITTQAAILDLLLSLTGKYQTSMIFISHDMNIIGKMSDQVAVMQNGFCVEQGPTEKILHHPRHPYTRALMACRPGLDYPPDKKLPTLQTAFEKTKESHGRIRQKERKEHQEVILEIKNLNKYFHRGRSRWTDKRKFHALKDIDLKIYKGETLGLIGESGSGKTTLGRVILQLLPLDQGQMYYRGRDMAHLSGSALKEFHRKVQVVFQDPYGSLNPKMKAGKTIQEVLRVHRPGLSRKEQKNKVYELLQLVRLSPESYERYPHEFSGGQRQRITLARALATEPEMIVCDEAVSALDVSIQAEMLNILNDLKEKLELTYLFISHDLALVKYMSDRLVVIRDGKILEQGPAQNIYENPKDPYTRELIRAVID